jgi:hypothetical protein
MRFISSRCVLSSSTICLLIGMLVVPYCCISSVCKPILPVNNERFYMYLYSHPHDTVLTLLTTRYRRGVVPTRTLLTTRYRLLTTRYFLELPTAHFPALLQPMAPSYCRNMRRHRLGRVAGSVGGSGVSVCCTSSAACGSGSAALGASRSAKRRSSSDALPLYSPIPIRS